MGKTGICSRSVHQDENLSAKVEPEREREEVRAGAVQSASESFHQHCGSNYMTNPLPTMVVVWNSIVTHMLMFGKSKSKSTCWKGVRGACGRQQYCTHRSSSGGAVSGPDAWGRKTAGAGAAGTQRARNNTVGGEQHSAGDTRRKRRIRSMASRSRTGRCAAAARHWDLGPRASPSGVTQRGCCP